MTAGGIARGLNAYPGLTRGLSGHALELAFLNHDEVKPELIVV